MRNKNLKGYFYLLTAFFLFLAFSGGLFVQDSQGKIVAGSGNNDGIQFINAQQTKTLGKPDRPKLTKNRPWQVEFVELTGEVNGVLKGSSEGPFRANDYTEVYVKGPKGACKCYHFFLRIEANDSDCALFFDDIESLSCQVDDQENSCRFPLDECVDPSACNCVACFLNKTNHPSKGTYESEEYRYGTILRFWIPEQYLSGLPEGVFRDIYSDPANPAYLDINIFNEAQTSTIDKPHSLYTITDLDGLRITKLSNGWEIEFNQPLVDLRESYKDTVDYIKGKKVRTALQFFYPLSVTTNDVHFKMIWTQ